MRHSVKLSEVDYQYRRALMEEIFVMERDDCIRKDARFSHIPSDSLSLGFEELVVFIFLLRAVNRGKFIRGTDHDWTLAQEVSFWEEVLDDPSEAQRRS